MAKACDCSAILEAYETDPRLLALPLAVRGLWLALVLRMRRMGQSVLLLGSVVPNLREIAMLVPMAETELETQLEQLLAHGMLVRREDGALECPLLAARMKRAETARINGLKGGRPRRDGQPPGQRSLIMAVPGGAAAAGAKTQAEPGAEAVGIPAKPAMPSEEKAKQAVPEDWPRVAQAAADAAGLDPAKGTWTLGVVREWMAQGADEALILGVIQGVMGRPNPPAVRGLGYFAKAIGEALAVARVAPAVVAGPVDAAQVARSEAWAARMEAYIAGGCQGPMPVREEAA